MEIDKIMAQGVIERRSSIQKILGEENGKFTPAEINALASANSIKDLAGSLSFIGDAASLIPLPGIQPDKFKAVVQNVAKKASNLNNSRHLTSALSKVGKLGIELSTLIK
jgi:hypothetical protein